jgi:hypothetical protein
MPCFTVCNPNQIPYPTYESGLMFTGDIVFAHISNFELACVEWVRVFSYFCSLDPSIFIYSVEIAEHTVYLPQPPASDRHKTNGKKNSKQWQSLIIQRFFLYFSLLLKKFHSMSALSFEDYLNKKVFYITLGCYVCSTIFQLQKPKMWGRIRKKLSGIWQTTGNSDLMILWELTIL